MTLPYQLQKKVTQVFFKLLPKSFISPIDLQSSGVDLQESLEYRLKPTKSKVYAEGVAGEGAIEYQYLAKYPSKDHSDGYHGYTGGIMMIFKDEHNMDDVDYNYEQIVRVIDILKEIKVIRGTLANNKLINQSYINDDK